MSRGGRGGKKRGDNAMSFTLESMGLSRGESLPSTLTPPPNFPNIDSKPLPLHNNDIDNYLLTLKQELRQSLMTSRYHINPPKDKPKIERYSDKYENIGNENAVNDNDIQIEWRIFPTELWPKKKRKIESKVKTETNKEIDKKLENLVETDDKSGDESSDKEVEENASEGEEKVEDLEDVEEGTDYTFSYFDNGEEYLEESDDNVDEGPTY